MINRRPAVTSMRMTADDVWAVVLVLPVLSLAFGWVTFGNSLFTSLSNFAKGYFPTFLLVTVFHVALVQISYAMRRRFPSHEDTTKRLLSALLLYLATSFAAIQFSLWLYDRIGLLGVEKTTDLTMRCMLVALVGNLVNGIMYDVFYTFAKRLLPNVTQPNARLSTGSTNTTAQTSSAVMRMLVTAGRLLIMR